MSVSPRRVLSVASGDRTFQFTGPTLDAGQQSVREKEEEGSERSLGGRKWERLTDPGSFRQ